MICLPERLKMRELLVDTVYDGNQALSFIDKVEPDVMVLDLRMPGLHGMEVLREINKLKRDIPVIILTGHGTEKDEEEARRLGASDFLRKPANIDLLVVSINRCNYA